MALGDEQADILGGPILQRPESGVFATVSQYYSVFKLVTLLGLGLLVWIACARGLEYLKKHRELRYKKAMRRKHGIPDSDCRPFAVAYAAAKRTHLEREAQGRKKTSNYVSNHNPQVTDQGTNSRKDACLLRRQISETTVQLHNYYPPGKEVTVHDNKRSEAHILDFVDRYNPNLRRRVAIPYSLPIETPPVSRASRTEPAIALGDNEESRKRSFEDENDVEHESMKKSRIDGDELGNADEQADWYTQYSDGPARRASIREYLNVRPKGNRAHMDGQERLKRVDDLRSVDDEGMEGIDEDEVAGLRAVARGRKRDWAEAGSTFGGDDEEDIRNGRASHHCKRRTILRGRTEVPTRGQKRDREVESPESEGEGIGSEASGIRGSKKKRGKRTACDEISRICVDGPCVSEDHLCMGRRIGDHWEANGVQYKVSDEGERLRLTLVRKSKNKYHMPQDSQHPDRSAALEIYVETWMTEEQYKQAEVRQELAWQEVSGESSGPKIPDVLDSPAKNGKNLLWDSAKCSPTRRLFRQPIPSHTSTRINPFEQWQLQPALGRRVASSSTTFSTILPGVTNSPTRPGFRGFSKWEKQDREAEAMARIRAKIDEQKKAQVPPQESVEIPRSVTAPELGTKPLSVPIITFTPTLAAAAEGKSDGDTSQNKSNVSTFSFATPNSSDSFKGIGAGAPTTTPGISLSPASVPAAISSTHFLPTTTILTTTSSFVKPPQVLSSTFTTDSSHTTPDIFGKGTSASMPPSSAPSPSTSGTTTQPQLPPTGSSSKPVSLSSTKPDTISSASAVVSSTATSQAPIFNISSNTFPSPVTSGFTSAATEPETPVPPATSESSKPIAPLFSFPSATSSNAPLPISPVPSMPKFSFEKPSTSTHAPTSNPAPGMTSQPEPTFKFGQTPLSTTDGASEVSDESKKPARPMSAFGTAAGLNEPAKPSLFGTTSAFGSSSSNSPLASATNLFRKSITVDSDSPSTPPKLLASMTTTTSDNTVSSTPVGALASGNTPVFSFGVTNSGLKPEGSRPPGGAAGVLNVVAASGGNSVEGKPTFIFGTSANGSKFTPTFGGNVESSKPPSIFGSSVESTKPTFMFGSSAEASKPALVSGDAARGSRSTFPFSSDPTATTKPTSPFATTSDSSKASNIIHPPKPTPTPGSTTVGTFPSASPFPFGRKDDSATTNTTTSTGAQAKPATPFAFAASSGTTSLFGHPPAYAMSDESSQSVFGKPTNVTSSVFGLTGTIGPSSSNTFTFKPAAQNQKQEQ